MKKLFANTRRTLLTHTGIVIKPLMHDLAVLPLGHDDLLHVHRLSAGGNKVQTAFVERDIVAHSRSRHVEPFPLLDAAQKLLFSLDRKSVV